MNIGYTIFVNKKWEPLAKVLVDALEIVSKYKVELFCINFETSLKNKNLIKRQIYVERENRSTICYSKLEASFKSEFDFGLIMDADMIPNKNIDELLEKNYKKYKKSKYPICSKHPHNVWEQYKPQTISLMKLLNMDFEITIPYKYGSYFFTKYSKDFFKDVFKTSNFCLKNNITPFSYDETLINLYLNKYNATTQLEYNYLPNTNLYESVLDNNMQNDSKFDVYRNANCEVQPYIFHGCKNPNEAEHIKKIILNKI